MGVCHIIMQSKGGSGKSFVAAAWLQFLRAKDRQAFGIDTDPSNHTLAGIANLGVSSLDILNSEKAIDPRKFDSLIESIVELDKESHLVVDTGSSCYPVLRVYLKESDAFKTVQNKEKEQRVFLHVPIVAGGSLVPCLESLQELMEDFPDIPVIIWKNPYNGDIELDEKKFEEFDVYEQYHNHMRAIVNLPRKNPSTFGKDIEILLTKRLTFDAAIHGSDPMMYRQRLSTYWNEAFAAMEPILQVF
jgi:hypothetical protein